MADFYITPLGDNPSFNRKPSVMKNMSTAGILKTLIILGVVLILIAVGLFIFGGSSFDYSGIDFKIDGPAEASTGQEVIYTIKYKNNTNTELEKIRLGLFYPPESLILKGAEISDVLSERVELNNIKPGEEGSRELHIFLIGDKGSIKTTKAVLSFKPSSVRSEFQKETTLATTITSVPVSLTLVAPPNASSGQRIAYILDYRNESGEDLSDIRFEFEFPENFSPQSFLPAPSSGNSIWNIAKIKKGQGERIKIEGIISGNEKESKTISVVLKKKVNEKFITYEKAISNTILSGAFLELDVRVNNSKDYISFPGDMLDYSINFKNGSQEDLNGVTLFASLEGSMFDLSTISTNGFFDSRTKTISWNASSNPQLGLIRPNERGVANFKIQLNGAFPSSGIGSKDFFIKTVIRGQSFDSGDGSEILSQNEIITRLKTSPTLIQTGYANSVFGSSGPIPPKVDKKTEYTIYWRITNPGSDILQAKISAALPESIKWGNSIQVNNTTSQITYNSGLGRIVWDIGVVPSRSGAAFPPIEGYFLVSITPSESNKGSAMDILRDIKFEGVDSFTKQVISLTVGNVTTGTIDDGGGGVVE